MRNLKDLMIKLLVQQSEDDVSKAVKCISDSLKTSQDFTEFHDYLIPLCSNFKKILNLMMFMNELFKSVNPEPFNPLISSLVSQAKQYTEKDELKLARVLKLIKIWEKYFKQGETQQWTYTLDKDTSSPKTLTPKPQVQKANVYQTLDKHILARFEVYKELNPASLMLLVSDPTHRPELKSLNLEQILEGASQEHAEHAFAKFQESIQGFKKHDALEMQYCDIGWSDSFQKKPNRVFGAQIRSKRIKLDDQNHDLDPIMEKEDFDMDLNSRF